MRVAHRDRGESAHSESMEEEDEMSRKEDALGNG
jgi:hypothetical protein